VKVIPRVFGLRVNARSVWVCPSWIDRCQLFGNARRCDCSVYGIIAVVYGLVDRARSACDTYQPVVSNCDIRVELCRRDFLKAFREIAFFQAIATNE
jgi:hypothetical protein